MLRPRWPLGSSRLLFAVAVEIDGRGDRQAGDHRLLRSPIEGDPHGYALSDLYPVAIRILRRKQRELAPGARADALHMGGEFLSGISVDLNLGPLTGDHPPHGLLL